MDPEKQTIKKIIQETEGEDSSQASTNSLSFPASLELPVELAIGSVIADGRYRIISTIGRGAIGCVYEVEQTYMKKRLAMKVLLSGQTSDYDLKRFQKEAQAASRLEHQNLVHAVDFGMLGGGQPYLVMDLIVGTTLANFIKEKGPMSVELAIDTFIPVCLALDYAHHEGIVHRDIKPTNIILEGTRSEKFVPKIVDFGIAKLNVHEETALTQIGEVLGTPLYMSPEQCAGEPVDLKSDIYSLGCVIFESLTGAPPFCGKNSLVTMMSHRHDEPPSLREASMGFNFPRALETMMEKMLAKNPRDRYASCMEIAQDFEYLKRGESQKIKAISLKSSGAASKKNGKLSFAVVSIVVVLSLLLVAGAFIALFKIPEGSDKAAAPGAKLTSSSKGSPSSSAPSSNSPANPASNAAATISNTTGSDDDLSGDLHFADVKEGSFCRTLADQRIYAFPNNDVIGTLYWWRKGSSEPGEHPAQGLFYTPGDAKPLFDIGWNIIAHKGTYLTGFSDDILYGAFINVRASWEAWGDDNALNKALKLLENQSRSLRILELITKQTEFFSFSKGQLDSLNKLSLVQWLLVRNCGLSGAQLIKFDFFPRLKVLGMRRMADCGLVLDKLRSNKNIQRLSIFDCTLSKEDLHNLGQLRTLRMLEVRQSKIVGYKDRARSDLLENIADLPNLEQLCIDTWNIQDAVDQKQLPKLKKLKVLSIADANSISPKEVPEMMRSIQAKLPNCKIELLPYEKECTFREWCDPVKINPGKVISWE
jgi:serine/threonine protein kinase